MRWFRWIGFLWIIWIITPSYTLQVDLNTIIECDNLTNTPLLNNPTIFAMVLQICLNDARCRDLYGQDFVINEELFAFLFQTTTEFIFPITFEEPIQFIFCNKTLLQALQKLWLIFLKMSMLDHDQVCALDAFPVFSKDRLSTKCKDLPTSGNSFESDIDNISLTIFVIILLLVMMGVPKSIIESYYNITRQIQIGEFLRNNKQ